MKPFIGALFIAMLSSSGALAGNYGTVPLMPDGQSSSVSATGPTGSGVSVTPGANADTNSTGTSNSANPPNPANPGSTSTSDDSGSFGLGVELGALGRQWTTDGRFVPLDVLMGGRIFADLDVGAGFVIRPSIGYFGSYTSVGITNVFQSDIEGGLAVYYEAVISMQTRFLFGAVNRTDILLATVSLPYGSTYGPTSFEDRLGPAIGFELGIGPRTQITVDTDATFSVVRSGQPYGSITAGVIQRF